MSGTPCLCGLYAVGECVKCGRPCCAEHGRLGGERFRCLDCDAKRQASLDEKAAAQRHRRAKETYERTLVEAASRGREALLAAGLVRSWSKASDGGRKWHLSEPDAAKTLCGRPKSGRARGQAPPSHAIECQFCASSAQDWRLDLTDSASTTREAEQNRCVEAHNDDDGELDDEEDVWPEEPPIGLPHEVEPDERLGPDPYRLVLDEGLE